MRQRSSRPTPAAGHPLCPDRETLDRFLAGLLSLFGSQPHRAAAMFELIPAWLRFLERRGLLTADEHSQTLSELEGLTPDLTQVMRGYPSDPALRHAIETWPQG